MRTVAVALLILSAACAPSTEPDQAIDTSALTRPLELTSAEATPSVDLSTASVPLADILFDTFDGRSTALSEISAETITRLHDAIAPIDAPDYESADEADWLTEEDLVVGYLDRSGNAWAYPVRILNRREIVNDELSGQPLVVTYCPLCGSGVVFSREFSDRSLAFSNTSALYENDMVMVDRETGSYWWQVAGEAVVGPLTGSELALLPSQTTTWSSWRAQYPGTAVMVRPADQDYSQDSFGGYAASLDAGRTPFPVSDVAFADDRLPPSARVVVVTVNGITRAWAAAPARRIDDEVGGVPLIVTLDGTGGSVTDPDGVAVPSRSAYWFSIVSVFPDVPLG